MSYRITQVLFVFLAMAWANVVQASAEAWMLWQQPGVHAIMRHATAPGFGDPEGFTLGNCATQRNLSAAGKAEAKRLGQAIKNAKVQLTAVYSSQWCRCVDTAKALDVGKVQELSALNSFFEDRSTSAEQTEALKAHLGQLPTDAKVLYVTHQVNTTALTGVFPASGEIILFRITPGGEIEVVGRIKPT